MLLLLLLRLMVVRVRNKVAQANTILAGSCTVVTPMPLPWTETEKKTDRDTRRSVKQDSQGCYGYAAPEPKKLRQSERQREREK